MRNEGDEDLTSNNNRLTLREHGGKTRAELKAEGK